MDRKILFHHEGHEEHEVLEYNCPNLRVLRAFVVKMIFGLLLPLRHGEIFIQPFAYNIGQARVLFIEGKVIDVG